MENKNKSKEEVGHKNNEKKKHVANEEASEVIDKSHNSLLDNKNNDAYKSQTEMESGNETDDYTKILIDRLKDNTFNHSDILRELIQRLDCCLFFISFKKGVM